jgi:hypothetical protein
LQRSPFSSQWARSQHAVTLLTAEKRRSIFKMNYQASPIIEFIGRVVNKQEVTFAGV